MEFLWTQGLKRPEFSRLNGDMETDVLVIGGGMAGILCALRLQQAGVECVVAEADTVGSGITKGTTAVLTAQHDTLYTDLIETYGRDNARRYLTANLDAVEAFAELSKTFPCSFQRADSVMYTHSDGERLAQEAEAVRSLGFEAEFCTKTPLPFPVAGAVRYPGMAQFHPLAFLYGAAKQLCVFEHTPVRRLDGTMAQTDSGRIRAQKVIVATHFPFINRHGMYFMKLYQNRSYIIAYDNAPNLECTFVSTAEDGFYLRNFGSLLLIGGGEHRTGKKGGGFAPIEEFARRYFPQAEERFRWATQDCMSLDGLPYVGAYSPKLPDVFTATGFNEWGMTTSMVAAQTLTALVQGRPDPLMGMLSPDRKMRAGQLAANLGTTLLNFLTPTARRCSHLGCALKWNPQEHSWDCPCHGSRFRSDGRLIDNPAMKDIKIKMKNIEIEP